MAQPQQNFRNHARYVPLFHVGLFALIAVNFVHVARTLQPFDEAALYRLIVATAWLLAFFYLRAFPLTVQDRVIRLEERLRLQSLAPDLAARSAEITPGQWTALRFASDAELPGLARDVLAGKLSKPGDIKRAIREWRPDHLRV